MHDEWFVFVSASTLVCFADKLKKGTGPVIAFCSYIILFFIRTGFGGENRTASRSVRVIADPDEHS
jgi:hypothetical protein